VNFSFELLNFEKLFGLAPLKLQELSVGMMGLLSLKPRNFYFCFLQLSARQLRLTELDAVVF
jgi:hypothetical protein